MYLPLTGFKDREDFERKMSIDAIGPGASQFINPLDKTDRAHQETRKIDTESVKKRQDDQKTLDNGDNAVVDQHYASNSLSTQDFVILKSQSNNEQFKILDEVIERMKEEIEETGEAIEAMAKLAKKASKDNLALQILEKTLDAIDEVTNDR